MCHDTPYLREGGLLHVVSAQTPDGIRPHEDVGFGDAKDDGLQYVDCLRSPQVAQRLKVYEPLPDVLLLILKD